MLDVIYSRAGEWWEIYKLRNNAVFSTEASRQDGLRYLFSIPNNDGELPLEYAADHASAPVIEVKYLYCNANLYIFDSSRQF